MPTPTSPGWIRRAVVAAIAVALAFLGLGAQPAAAAVRADFSGTGNWVSDRFVLDPGIYVLELTYRGDTPQLFAASLFAEGEGYIPGDDSSPRKRLAAPVGEGTSGATKQLVVSGGEKLWLEIDAAGGVSWTAKLARASIPGTVKTSIALNATGTNAAKLFLLEKGVYTYQVVSQGKNVLRVGILAAKPNGEESYSITRTKASKKLSQSGTFTLRERSLVWIDPMTAWPGESWTVTVNTSQPTISGTLAVGKKLTAKTGTPGWAPANAKFSYQWRHDGKKIRGATASTYTLKASDRGKKISVTVTAAKKGSPTVSMTSAKTKAVKLGGLTSATPKITGTAKVGKELKAKPGTWKPSGVKFSYQWLRDGKPIKGATTSTYKLKQVDKGKRISVTVKGSKTGYTSVARTSKATAEI